MTKRYLLLIVTLALVAIVTDDVSAQPTGEKRGRREKHGKYDERADIGLRVGEMAPDFTLMSPGGKTRTNLDTLRAERPVVLFFGSYT